MKCPRCGSENLWKPRLLKIGVGVKCEDCGKWFVIDNKNLIVSEVEKE